MVISVFGGTHVSINVGQVAPFIRRKVVHRELHGLIPGRTVVHP